jgi:hypothetical protein
MRTPISSPVKTNMPISMVSEKNQKAKNAAARNGREIETISGKTLWTRVKTKAHDLAQSVRIKIDAAQSHKVINPKYCVAKTPAITTPPNPLVNANPSAQIFNAPAAATQALEPQPLTSPTNSPAPTRSTQWVIQDIDPKLVPLPRAAVQQPNVKVSAPVNDTMKTEATRYVAAESKAPEYKALKNKIVRELEVTRMKYDDLFLDAVNQPVAEGRYSAKLEKLDGDYDAAYHAAFDEIYILARQEGYTESAALIFAANMAQINVFIEFEESADPDYKAYAKVMDKFQQKIELTSEQKKTFSVAYVLAAESSKQPAAPEAAPVTVAVAVAAEVKPQAKPRTLSPEALAAKKPVPAQRTSLKELAMSIPADAAAPAPDMGNSARPRVAVTSPKTLPTDHVTLKALGSKLFAVLAEAPVKTPRLAVRPEPAIREEVITRETSLPATSREAKKTRRSISSLLASSSKLSVKTVANRLLRRNVKSVNLPASTGAVAQSNGNTGTNVPGLQSYRTNEIMQNDSKNTDKNVKLRSYIQTGNE